MESQGFAEAYKDLVHEQSIKFRGMDTNTKFIHYTFRIGGVMKFIVEAKNPQLRLPTMQNPLSRYDGTSGTRNSISISLPISRNGLSITAGSGAKTLILRQRAG